MRPRHSARLLSILVATSITGSARLATAEPDNGGHGRAALNQPLGEDVAPAPAAAPVHHSHPELAKGDSGDTVLRAQRLLNRDRRTRGADAIAEDGVFGSETLQALRTFQRAHGLEQTGKTDAETWAELEKYSADAASAPSPSSSNGTRDAGASTRSDGTASGGASSAGDTSTGAARTVEDLLSSNGHPAPAHHDTAKVIWHQPMHLSAASLDVLARIIESEAGVCSDEGKVAVAAVILNRVRSGWANGTVHGVVSESGQFDGYDNSTYRARPSQAAIDAAKRAAAGEDPSLGAVYYFNPYLVHPSWAKSMHRLVRIGTSAENTHDFYRP